MRFLPYCALLPRRLMTSLVFSLCLFSHASVADNIHYGSQLAELDFDQQFSSDDRQVLQDWLRIALDALMSVYGVLPQDHIKIRIEPYSGTSGRSPVPWGEVIRSHSVQSPDTVKLLVDLSHSFDSLRADWTVFHELSHLFIPYKSGSRWVSEGLASYYQNVIQARAGLLTEQQMWEKLLAGFERARAQNNNSARSLDYVSSNTRQYMRIHWHGALFWLDMDFRLRSSTNNQQSLDTALLNLKQCCEKQSMSPINIMRALDKANDLALFENNYLAYRQSTSITAYRDLLRAMGVQTDGKNVEFNDEQIFNRSISKGIAQGVSSVEPVPDLKAIARRTGVGAASWALVEGADTVALGASGYYSNAGKRPVHADSVFRIGSISKTLLALASAKLSEQSLLDLDKPVRAIAPKLPLHSAWQDTAVTTRMLLEHSAGLGRLSRKEFDYPTALSLQEALRLEPQNRTLLWPPGHYSQYSNAGAGLVSRVIEVRTGETFDDWFQREVLQGLGMQQSSITWSAQLQSQLVSGYDRDLQTQLPYWHTLFRAFGGVSATARDMSKVLKVFTNRNSKGDEHWLSTASVSEMARPQTTVMARAGVMQGRGMGLSVSQYRGHWLWSHNGDADGYLARFAYSPATERAYYVVINAFRHDLLRNFVNELDVWLVEDGAEQEVQAAIALNDKQLERYLGDYRQITASRKKREISIGSDADGLFWYDRRKIGYRNRLIALGNDKFRAIDEFAASTLWVRMEDASILLQGPMGSYRRISP
ncbi:MAG: serine hydrolase [Pseudomonadales bacterium]